MNVLIAGGTGFVGRHLCEELLGRNLDVVAMSRDPDPADVPDGVELRQGDITEYEGLEDAIRGMDAVVHLVALSALYRPRGGQGMHERVHVQGTRNLARAMESVGIDRLIHMSGIGADPDGQTAYLRAKGRAEGIVRSADLAATIFRPAVIFGEGDEFVSFIRKVTTPYITALPGGGQTPFQPIWVREMVSMLADAIEDDRHSGASYDIGGPDVLTLADITRAIYRADGRSVRIIPVPFALSGIGFTLAGPLPLIPFGRDQYRALRMDHSVESNEISAFDLAPEDLRRFDAYLRDRAPEN